MKQFVFCLSGLYFFSAQVLRHKDGSAFISILPHSKSFSVFSFIIEECPLQPRLLYRLCVNATEHYYYHKKNDYDYHFVDTPDLKFLQRVF